MIKNLTQNSLISGKEKVCSSFTSHAFGLMFRKKQNIILQFKTQRYVSLHMFFVFFPIDVLVIDTTMRIVDIKRNFKPWSIWRSKTRGKYVVELANKAIYEIGDQIKLLP